MKNTLLTFLISFSITSLVSAQQIGEGLSTEITDFSVSLKSGAYQGLSPNGMNPDISYSGWQHLFVVRHSNLSNNHQLQLSSSYTENDRLFFRKKALTVNPEWIELATRGANNFVGNQSIAGYVGIGNSAPDAPLTVYGVSNFYPIRPLNNGSGDVRRLSVRYSFINPQFIDNLYPLILGTGGGNQPLILDAARVGIGTVNPSSMLTVAGNITSREVKVTVDAGADFVFNDNYNLPSLESVEKFIKVNNHLPEIASAQKMQEEGINLSEMNIKLLQKIEELTLYTIEQHKELEQLKTENENYKSLVERVSTIEKELKK